MKDLPKFYNCLNKIKKEIFFLLNQGVEKRKSNFHTLVLATTNEQNRAEVRTVVLRSFSEKNMLIGIHSDIRANKIKELKRNNKVSLLFYDEEKKIQLRIRGEAKILDSHKNSWDKLNNWSRRCYLTEISPGKYSKNPTSGFPEKFSINQPKKIENEEGIKNFCLIQIYINQIEWLYLASIGNRRAIFDFSKKNNETLQDKKWIVP